MAEYSAENSDLPADLQNEMDYATRDPVLIERGSSLLDVDQYYDCVEQLNTPEAQRFEFRNPRFGIQNSVTELFAPLTSVSLVGGTTAPANELDSRNTNNTSQRPGSGTSEQTTDEQKVAKRLKYLRISYDKQALSAALRNLQEFGEEIKQTELIPEQRNSDPYLGPSDPKASEVSGKGKKDKDKSNAPLIRGPTAAGSCSLHTKKTVSASNMPAKEITTLRKLRLDSLEDYFRLDT